MISLSLCLACLVNNQLTAYVVAVSVYGFVAFPMIPVTLELSTRHLNHVPIFFTNSLMFLTSQIFSVCLQVASGLLFDYYSKAGMAVFSIVISLYTLGLVFVKDLDRH